MRACGTHAHTGHVLCGAQTQRRDAVTSDERLPRSHTRTLTYLILLDFWSRKARLELSACLSIRDPEGPPHPELGPWSQHEYHFDTGSQR